jgi:hypothetical protein
MATNALIADRRTKNPARQARRMDAKFDALDTSVARDVEGVAHEPPADALPSMGAA